MAQDTVPVAPASDAASGAAPAPRPLARLRAPGNASSVRWLLGGLGLVVLAVLVTRGANTRPGFDPYGWLTWGKQTLEGHLDTNAAPSWKPLPYLFTVPYALFGHFQLWLWMTTSVAVALSGIVFAARIVHRTLDAAAARRWAALLAGLFAAVALNLITQASPQYSIWHYILSDQSDPMIVALCLAAIDCHLCGRYRGAVLCAALAGLGRPEVWALLGPYGVWLWFRRPTTSLRVLLLVGVVAMAALWFGIPALSSRSAFVAADNAFYSGRRLTHDQIGGTVSRFLDLLPRGLEIGALLSFVYAIVRRDRVTLALGGMVVVWMVVEVAMVLHGWPGVPRYMFEPAALLVVMCAIGLGRALTDPPASLAPIGLAGIAGAIAVAVRVVPFGVSAARHEHGDIVAQRLRTRTLNLLDTELAGYGDPDRFRACGEPLTRLQYQSAVAWALHDNVATVGFKYGPAIAATRPIVLITPYPQAGSGWQITAYRQRSTVFCRSLPAG